MRKIPALIVSGFLGSGKTTLVRRLLAAAQQEGSRVAFISNELGELGVDAALLGGGESSFVELAGGCVCCALNDALHETLIALHARMDPDRIVVETSGVAVRSRRCVGGASRGVVLRSSKAARALRCASRGLGGDSFPGSRTGVSSHSSTTARSACRLGMRSGCSCTPS